MKSKVNSSSKKGITKDMTISKIVENHPDSAGIMLSFGLHCVGCHVSEFETLEQGIKGHGGTDEHVDMIVKEINNFINNKDSEMGSCDSGCACH